MDVSPRPVRTIHPLSDAYFIHTEMCLSRFISQKHILEAVKLPSLVFYFHCCSAQDAGVCKSMLFCVCSSVSVCVCPSDRAL